MERPKPRSPIGEAVLRDLDGKIFPTNVELEWEIGLAVRVASKVGVRWPAGYSHIDFIQWAIHDANWIKPIKEKGKWTGGLRLILPKQEHPKAA